MKGAQTPKQNEDSSLSEAKSKKESHSAFAGTTSKEDSHSNHGSLIQTTISTLFKKVEKKVTLFFVFFTLILRIMICQYLLCS